MARGSLIVTLVIAAKIAPATESGLDTRTLEDVKAMVGKAAAEGWAGLARKTRPVDARRAKAGEIVVTVIKGEGKETQSRPARVGDYVVRNRCPATGHEQYLVAADKFQERYRATGAQSGPDGWQEFLPLGKDMRFVILGAAEHPFSFDAPWGEPMVARPGDAIVQDPEDAGDVYRVARASFECTYEVLRRP
jgi:hypothetical protein